MTTSRTQKRTTPKSRTLPKKGARRRRAVVDQQRLADTVRRVKQSPVRAAAGAASPSSTKKAAGLVTGPKPKEARETQADMLVSGVAINGMTALRIFRSGGGDVDLGECLAKLRATIDCVHRGDLRAPEALLLSQSVTLNMLFAHLATLAQKSEYLDTFERYLRLALKAQAQCRTTLATLADMKATPTLLARQTNIALGAQQVNNNLSPAGPTPSDPCHQTSQPTRLGQLATDERLDPGTAGTPGAGDSPVATVAALDRSRDGHRESEIGAKRFQRRVLEARACVAQEDQASLARAARSAAEDLNGLMSIQ